MNRFFRTIRPFIKAIGNISPLCVSFSVASTVPTMKDAPDYVQDVFKQFNTAYIQKMKSQSIEETHDNSDHTITGSTPSVLTTQQTQTIRSQPDAQEAVPPSTESLPEPALPTKPNVSSVPSNKYLSRFIDHTVLKPLSSEDDIHQMCAEAMEHNFFSVCCNPCWVELCKELLKDSNVRICCVVGFPLGSNTTQIKVLEAQKAVQDGANEIDMVMNIGSAKSGNWEFVHEDIAMVVASVGEDVTVKVIIETCLLSDDEIVSSCKCVVNAGAHFVKTSTGFSGGGATVHDVSLMRKTVDEEALKLGMEIGSIFVKASGGIRDSQTAKEMMRAGADRIGASKGITIVQGGPIDAATQTLQTDTQTQY